MENKLNDYISILNIGNNSPELNIGTVNLEIPADKITIEEAEYFHQHGLDIIIDADKNIAKIELTNK